MTKTYTLPTLIKADTMTPGGNIYPAALLKSMADEANNRIQNGAMIPLRVPIESNELAAVKGLVKSLSIAPDGTLLAKVDVINEDMQKLIDVMKGDIVFNSQVICNHYNEKDGVRTLKDAELVALCAIAKREAWKDAKCTCGGMITTESLDSHPPILTVLCLQCRKVYA